MHKPHTTYPHALLTQLVQQVLFVLGALSGFAVTVRVATPPGAALELALKPVL
jgi:hypothetical protein